MFLDISENAFLESFDAGKDAAPELILGQVAEESFDHVEPAAAGGRVVENESAYDAPPSAEPPGVCGWHSCGRQGGAVCRRAFGDRSDAGTSTTLDGDDSPCKSLSHCHRAC